MRRVVFGRFAVLAAASLAVSACQKQDAIGTREQCEAAIASGKYEKMLPLLKAEVQNTPNDASLVLWLGLAYWKQNQADQAVKCFEMAQRLQPANSEPSEYLGYVEMQRKRWQRAETALSRALTSSPRNPRALTAMAVVRLGTNNVRSAQAYLKEALRVETNYPPALYDLAWLNYYKRRNPSEAAPLFRQYLAVAEDRGRATKAKAILKSIEEITPPTRPPTRATSRRPAAPR